MSRCSLLLLLTAAASFTGNCLLAEEAITPRSPSDARLAFMNAVIDAPKVDVIADNKKLFKTAHFGKAQKTKKIRPQGYNFDVFPSKIGLPIIDDLTTNVEAGKDYLLIPMGTIESTIPFLVQLPGQFVPKQDTHVVFVNASHDSPPLQLVLDGVDQGTSVSAASWVGPFTINAAKHRLEVFDGTTRVINEKVEKFKGSHISIIIVHGTFDEGDGSHLDTETLSVKSRD
jgi:hypothetical protein